MKNKKIDFFLEKENFDGLTRVNEFLKLEKKPYYLFIKRINHKYLYDAVDTIYNLQIMFKQPFILNKVTIRNILRNFLPYSFFLCLSYDDAIRLKKELYQNENLDMFIVVKKRENQNTSIFTYTNNFYNFNIDFYNDQNENEMVSFFEHYRIFLEKYFYKKSNIERENIKDLYGNNPVVLFDKLSLDEALFLIFYFNKKFPKLPIDLIPTETNLLLKKNKIKWT